MRALSRSQDSLDEPIFAYMSIYIHTPSIANKWQGQRHDIYHAYFENEQCSALIPLPDSYQAPHRQYRRHLGTYTSSAQLTGLPSQSR